MTPIYDVLTVQPSFDGGHIRHSQMKMAMCVGRRRHYRFDSIHVRHFLATGRAAGLAPALMQQAIDEVVDGHEAAMADVGASLPDDFPEALHESVSAAISDRIRQITATTS